MKKELLNAIVARIKIISGMNISEKKSTAGWTYDTAV